MKTFMTKLKTNPNELEIPGKRHNGVPVQIGKQQPVKLDTTCQHRALKIRQKAQGPNKDRAV
jgi:hypothetical protein